MIEVRCRCGEVFHASEDHAGRSLSCSRCGTVNSIVASASAMRERTPPASSAEGGVIGLTVETPKGSASSPWLSMWTRPRRTIRQIVESDRRGHVIALAAIPGVWYALDRASVESLGDRLPLLRILAASTIMGTLWGITLMYFYALALHASGYWLRGRASTAELRAAIAWPNVITIWALLLWIPEVLIFGDELFTTVPSDGAANPLQALFPALVLLEAVAVGWAVVVFLKCVGEVQGFSVWRALANAFLAGLVLIAPLVVIRFIVNLVRP